MTRSPFGMLVRFCMVGTLGLAVDVAVLSMALHLMGWGFYTARLLSFTVAVTCSWFLNRRHTFGASHLPAWVEWGRFVSTNAVGGLINYGVYAWVVHGHDALDWRPAAGAALGSLAGLAVNFTLSRHFVWRRTDRPDAPHR